MQSSVKFVLIVKNRLKTQHFKLTFFKGLKRPVEISTEIKIYIRTFTKRKLRNRPWCTVLLSVQLVTHFSFSLGWKTRNNPENTSKQNPTLLTGLYFSFFLTPLLVTGHMNTQRRRRLRPESVNDREESCLVIYLTGPDNFPADFQRTLSINSAGVSMGEIKH